MKRANKSIDWIDGLKGLAIVAILLNHFVESFGSGPWFSNPMNNWQDFSVRMTNIFPKDGNIIIRGIKFLGWLGDMAPGVFFLLSGLTLTMSSLNKPLKPFEFYFKRLARIYPLYIVIHLIILIVGKYWFKWDIHFFYPSTLLSLLGLRFTDSLFFYINPSWWFIWVIIQMYILFPFLLILLKKYGIKKFLLITVFITILSRLFGIIGITYSGSLYAWMTGLFVGTRLFEFTFGMFLGYLLFYNNHLLSKLLLNKKRFLFGSFCIYALGFVLSWTYIGSIFSNIFITIGLSGLFYFIFEIILTKNARLKSLLLWLGKNSFSVFLLHQPFMIYLSPLLNGIQKGIMLIIVIILSFIVGHFIEKLITFFAKIIQIHQKKINNFFNSELNRVMIFASILLAMMISFLTMLGLSGSQIIFKLLLLFILGNLLMTRIAKNFTTSFSARFFDVVLILSLIILIITENWFSTYWILLILSAFFLFLTSKLKHTLSIFISIFLLITGICILENYLKNYRPVEVLTWGEIPALQIDSTTGYSLIPNKSTHLTYNNYNYFIKTNSLGFTSPEINLAGKRQDEIRILIIGDAFSMPEGTEYTNSYPYLLELALREKFQNLKINVINAGVTGYGPNEEYEQLKNNINIINPDIVINQFFVNEFDDINGSKSERRSGIGFFVDNSNMMKYFGNAQIPKRLNDWAKQKMGLIDKSYQYNKSLLFFYEKNAYYYNDTVINKVNKYLDAMRNLCLLNNAKYLVMYVPGQIEVSKPKDIVYYPYLENLKDTNLFNFNLPQKIIHDLCSENRIDYLNPKEYLKSYSVQPLYFKESWHWNKQGHIAIAKYLANYLVNDNLILRIAH